MNNMVIPLEALQGTWYIHFSNFPMWLKGDKTNPTFNYTIEKQDGIEGLKDEVIYLKKGKQKSIVGFDKSTNTTNTQFVWRGRGLLSLLKSKWQVLYVDPTNTWAVIGFEKTLFTPSGYDVISKNKQISSDFEQIVKRKLKELSIFETLKTVEQR
jgi:lipocalin